jgi:hypothetical protein
MAKMTHIKPALCVFAKLFYSSGYTAPEMHHQQANAIQTTQVRMSVQEKAAAIACLHEQKSADIQQES